MCNLKIVSIIILTVLFQSCYVLNNPMDSQADNYDPTLATTNITLTGATSTTIAPIVANGIYRLFNVGSTQDQMTDNNAGAPVYNATYAGQTNMRWTITSVGGYFSVVNVMTNRCFEASGPSSTASNFYTGADKQLWIINDVGAGQYSMVNKLYSTAAHSQSSSAGNPVQLSAYNAANDLFKWEFRAP